MTSTHKAHVPMVEQLRLINEYRQSGMTDVDWCRENDIPANTFYNWISQCWKAAADSIQTTNYSHLPNPRSKQDVVPIDIIPDSLAEQHTAFQMHKKYLDNSHTIEVTMKDVIIRICNDADSILLARTLRLFQETLCWVISPDLKRFTLSAAIRTCANRLVACVPLSKTNWRWIHRPMLSFFSAEEDGTGAKHCSMSPMASS